MAPKFLEKCMCCFGGGKMTDVTSGVQAEVGNQVLDKLCSQGLVQKAAIFSFPDGKVVAKNFDIDETGAKNLIAALQGDTSLIEEGVKLGGGLPVYSPGKIEEGLGIYGTEIAQEGGEAPNGGFAALKTLNHVIVATFEKDLEGATNFAKKIAQGATEQGF